ncbi:uncharacterized protein LOC101849165 [Aplysia californica]|uniref:Uncharacterized protein LOC101849165 n=1 Tax=Aplysia californica TaxID=6500 RepID=A0ABM1ABJ4_APLCA|nr:uncharacterized protein LOC101849165 [Aplysia californica]
MRGSIKVLRGSIKVDPSCFPLEQEAEVPAEDCQEDVAAAECADNASPISEIPRPRLVLQHSQSCDVESESATTNTSETDSEVLSGLDLAPETIRRSLAKSDVIWTGGSSSGTSSPAPSVTMEKRVAGRPSLSEAKQQISEETRKFLTFVKRKFRRGRRSKRETSVQEIHIDPEEDEDRWASRAASGYSSNSSGSSTSQASSSGLARQGSRNSNRGSISKSSSSSQPAIGNLEVVHDLDDDFNPDYRHFNHVP